MSASGNEPGKPWDWYTEVAAWLSDQGLAVSPGTLANTLKRFVALFEPVAEAILAHQNEAALRHADETSWRVQALREEGRSSRAWLWTSVSNDAVYFHIDPSRSAEAAHKLFAEAVLYTVIVCGRYDRHTKRSQPRKDIWLRPLRKDWKRTLNR